MKPISLSDFDYHLPKELIAEEPMEPRDHSRLLVLHRSGNVLEHRHFFDLPDYLGERDCLVINDTRVFPARLFGRREGTGGKVEILLIEPVGREEWLVLSKPARAFKFGVTMVFTGDLRAKVVETRCGGERVLAFEGGLDPESIKRRGEIPLPPYIKGKPRNPEGYQTVYGNREGSSAAPTAGLHFTEDLLDRIRQKGCRVVAITLHVGPGTFLPVRTERVVDHVMHEERYWVSPEVEEAVNSAGRVVAVGTTVTRTLEACADEGGHVKAGAGRTNLFIYPGYRYRVVDTLITNFHLPRSTLLMLVAAFAGTEKVLQAYDEAIRQRYRFFSFGDAMLIL